MPTDGIYFRSGLSLSLPVLDMQFYKLSFAGERHWPMANNMSFKARGVVGYADSYGDKKFPFFKNFFMGGPKSVRGYDQASIGEKFENVATGELETTGGKKSLFGQVELFFPPPGLKNVESFRLSTFLDGGGVYKEGFNGDAARFSAGISALWLSPFGPLTLSYAKPLNQGVNDKVTELQFGMGGAF